MFNIGLVSVSFRQLSAEEIFTLCRDCGLSYIEWGSDVHAPCGDREKLRHIARLQAEEGVQCSSYGAYFRVGTHPVDELPAYIEAARILGTDVLRLWCGTKDYEDMAEDERVHIIGEAKKAARVAEREGVTLCMECHNHTFTSCHEGALALMTAVDSLNFRMYWQPNQFKSFKDNLAAAHVLAPYTQNIHVFHWDVSHRYPLDEGREVWAQYLSKFDGTQTLLLEFMPDDAPASLRTEAETLRQLVKGVKDR